MGEHYLSHHYRHQSHAEYSAREMDLPLEKYYVLPVSTDEVTFDADKVQDISPDSGKFQVFYYGSMLPLHGVDTVLAAMRLLKDRQDIELLMVGGRAKAKRLVEEAQRDGANVVHKDWIDYDQLPAAMERASVVLGGPFGGTVQSRYVITGKTYQQLCLGVSTIIGANLESGVFSDRQDALIVPQADAKALADTIVWAYHNRGQLPAIGQAGRELYWQNFSVDILTGKLEALLARFVKNP